MPTAESAAGTPPGAPASAVVVVLVVVDLERGPATDRLGREHRRATAARARSRPGRRSRAARHDDGRLVRVVALGVVLVVLIEVDDVSRRGPDPVDPVAAR